MAHLSLRLSYHDVRMFSQMLDSLPQQTQSARSRVAETHPVNLRSKYTIFCFVFIESKSCSAFFANKNSKLRKMRNFIYNFNEVKVNCFLLVKLSKSKLCNAKTSVNFYNLTLEFYFILIINFFFQICTLSIPFNTLKMCFCINFYFGFFSYFISFIAI